MTADPAVPLYAIQDRRNSGEWRTICECVDPEEAQRVAATLRDAGANVRIELVPQPIIP